MKIILRILVEVLLDFSCDRTLILINPSMMDTGNKLYEINCRVFVSIEIEINEVSQIMYIVMPAMGIKGLYIAVTLPHGSQPIPRTGEASEFG